MNGLITQRELHSQPERWQALLERCAAGAGLPDLDLSAFEELLFFGSGSSYYLALLLGELAARVLDARVSVLPSSEVFLHEARYLGRPASRSAGARLGVGISRSGESTEALLAAETLERHGVPLLAIGCRPRSALQTRAQFALDVPEGAEDGMVMLRSFTCMLLAFQVLLRRYEGAPDRALERLPLLGQSVLERHADALRQLAQRDFQRFVVLGSGLGYPLALEAALKFQEMAIVTTEAYHALEYRHGPKSTAAPDTLVTLFAAPDLDRYGPDLLRDLKEYGVTTLVIGEESGDYAGAADLRVDVASGLGEAERAVLALLPMHLLALETALVRGQNPDAPRNLAPVVRL